MDQKGGVIATINTMQALPFLRCLYVFYGMKPKFSWFSSVHGADDDPTLGQLLADKDRILSTFLHTKNEKGFRYFGKSEKFCNFALEITSVYSCEKIRIHHSGNSVVLVYSESATDILE